MEELKNQYLNKVNIVDKKSRNILLFTEMKKEEVMAIFHSRSVLEIKENKQNVISIKFSNAITVKIIQEKYNFQHYIMYSSFKKNDEHKCN